MGLPRALSHTSLEIIAVYFAVAVTYGVARHEVCRQEITSVWRMSGQQSAYVLSYSIYMFTVYAFYRQEAEL